MSRIEHPNLLSSFGSGFKSGSEMFFSDPDRIRIRPKVSDPSGSATLQSSEDNEQNRSQKSNPIFFLPDPDPLLIGNADGRSGSQKRVLQSRIRNDLKRRIRFLAQGKKFRIQGD